MPYESLYHAFADLHAATATESDRDRRLHAFNDWLRDINRGLRGDLIVRFVRTEYSFGLDQRAFGCEDVAVKAIQDHLMKWVLDGYFFSCSNEPLYPKAYYHRSCKNAGKDAAKKAWDSEKKLRKVLSNAPLPTSSDPSFLPWSEECQGEFDYDHLGDTLVLLRRYARNREVLTRNAVRGNPALSDVIMLLLDFTPKFAGSRHLRSLFNVVFRLFSVAHRRSCVSGPHHTLECDIEAYRLDLEWWIKHCPPDWKLAVSGLKMNEHRSRLALSLYCRQDLAPIWEVDIERVESELLAAARRWLDQQLCRARRAFRAAAENGRR